jgi:hypothetical protein
MFRSAVVLTPWPFWPLCAPPVPPPPLPHRLLLARPLAVPPAAASACPARSGRCVPGNPGEGRTRVRGGRAAAKAPSTSLSHFNNIAGS